MKKLLMAIVLAVTASGICHAASLTLEWDAPRYGFVIGGYQLDYGEYPNASGNTVKVEDATTQTVDNLEVGKIYCFRVRAIGKDGGMSEPSNIACWGPGLTMTPLSFVVKIGGQE